MSAHGPAGMAAIMDQVRQELAVIRERWGEQNHPDRAPQGRLVSAAEDFMRQEEANAARTRCEKANDQKRPGWDLIFLEEVREALAETHPDKLRAELVQVAAVAVQWIDCINRRQASGLPDSDDPLAADQSLGLES